MSGLTRAAILGALAAAGLLASPLKQSGALNGEIYEPRRRGRGLTAAQVKRMAKKAKNRRRHKAAMRRAA